MCSSQFIYLNFLLGIKGQKKKRIKNLVFFFVHNPSRILENRICSDKLCLLKPECEEIALGKKEHIFQRGK